MRNKVLITVLCLAAWLCCAPAAKADSVTLESNKAKASFSFKGGKFEFVNDFLDHESNFKKYEGTIKPGETITLSMKALGGYSDEDGIGANEAHISVSVVMKGSHYWEETPASRSEDGPHGTLPSLSTSYTVPDGAEAVSVQLGFSSTGGIDWAPMGGGVAVMIDYKVDQNADSKPQKETKSPLGFGKKKHGDGEDEGNSQFEEDNKAFEWEGWMDYVIPAAVIAGITGIAIRRRRKRRATPSDDGDAGNQEPEEEEEEDNQPAVRYAMRMYKEFGDTLIPGNGPRQVYAQIVKIPSQGEETPDLQLTSMLTVTGDNYLQVSPHAALHEGWKAADVVAPETDKAPEEGVVTFRLAGGKGSYTNHVHFKIRAGAIVFGQDNLTIPVGYDKPIHLPFLVVGMDEEAQVKAEIPGGRYEVKTTWNKETRLHEAIITEKFIPPKPGEKVPTLMPGEFERYSLKVTARSGKGSAIENELEVLRFQMGLALAGIYEVKCFIEEYDPSRHQTRRFAAKGMDGKTYVPAETKARITLFDYDENEHKVLEIAPVPTDYKIVALDDTKQDMVDKLAIQCDVNSGTIEDRARLCFFRCCQATLDAPSRIKAQIMLKTSFNGRDYYGYADVLLCSQPRRDLPTSEYMEALKRDQHISEQLVHIQSQIHYLNMYRQLFSLDKFIDTIVDGYSADYGYDPQQIETVKRIFNGVVSGESFGANGDVKPLTIADEVLLFVSCFFDKAKEVEDSMGFFSRLALGVATLGCADVVFTTLEVARSMKEYVDKGGDSVWGGFCVGAKIVGREYLMEKGMAFGMKKVGEMAAKAGITKDSLKDAFQEMKAEAGEFFSSIKGKVTKNAIQNSKNAMDAASRNADQFMDLVKSQKTPNPLDDAVDYGRKRALQDVKDLQAAVELYHMNPMSPENLKLKNQLVIKCQKNKQAMYLLQNYADDSLDLTRKELNETLGEMYAKADLNAKKTLSQIYGIPADRIEVFNASKNADLDLMRKGKKVTIDRDVTYFYRNAKGEKVYFDQNMTTQIYNHQIADAGLGFRSQRAELSNKFAKSIDQTNIEDVLNHPESYGKDIDILMDPQKVHMQLSDPKKVADAVTYKGKEWFREGDSLLKQAENVLDETERLTLRSEAVNKYMEGLRQGMKQFKNYINPRDIARAGENGGSKISMRLRTAICECEKLFDPGSKGCTLSELDAMLTRMGYTRDSLLEELGDTLFKIG